MWLLDNTRIFAQEMQGNTSQILPRLQPLSGGTVIQIFGYEDEIINLKFKVVGSGDVNTIKGMTIDGVTHTLSGPYGYTEDFYIKSFKYTAKPIRCQTLRPDLDSTAYVYDGEIEIYGG